MVTAKEVKGRKITRLYHNRILEEVYRQSPISREEIARRTTLGSSITHRHVRELKNRGIIEGSGLRESEGGRRTELFSINPKTGYLVGAVIRKRELIWLLTDFSGQILQSMSEKIGTDDKSHTIISKLSSGINKIVTDATALPGDIYGVGIGIPGLLDIERTTGVINIHVNDWRNIPLKEMIRKEVSLPVFLESNSVLTAMAESRFGLGRGVSNFLSMNISFGVGMGLFLNGQPYPGHQGRAGEAGHIQIDPDGPYCSCGNRGCLESLVSVPTLVAQARESISQGVVSEILHLANNNTDKIDIEVISQALAVRDKLAVNIMQKAADNIGLAVGNIINLLNPEVIILGGEIVKTGKEFLNMLNQAIGTIKSRPDTKAEIVYSKLRWPHNIAMGGIALVQKKIFVDNEIEIL